MDFINNMTQIVILQIIFILVCAGLLIAIGQRVLPWVAEKLSGRYRLYVFASVPVLRLFVIFTAAALIIPRIIDPSFENLVALLGAFGLAMGFAFKDYGSSLIAGIVTLYEMPYRLGDWISIEGTYGEVKSVGMRSAEIVTPDDTVVVIPHLKLWDKLIFNANDGSSNLQCTADFFLHPQHDPNPVIRTLNDVALTSAFLQIRMPVNVVVQEKPWATHYRLKAYPVDPRDQFQFITDLTTRGKTALAELKVKFAVPPVALEEGASGHRG